MPADATTRNQSPSDGAFACPECGDTLSLKGRTPGRQVLCGCGTLVEVPYLARVAPRRRRRDGRPRVPGIVWWFAGIVLAFSAALIVAKQVVRAQVRAGQVAEMASLSQDLADALQIGDDEKAVHAATAALDRADLPWEPTEAAEFRERRHRSLRRLGERRLDDLTTPATGAAIVEALGSLNRLGAEPGLEGLAADLRERIAAASLDRFAGEFRAIDAAIDDGRAVVAVDAVVRLLAEVRGLPSWAAEGVAERAYDRARRIAERFGAAVDPIDGRFWIGSPAAYEESCRPVLIDSLRRRGYAAEPDEATLRAIWKESSPYRLSLRIEEQPGPAYLQSANRTTLIDAQLVLKRPGDTEWQQRFRVGTTVPLPGLKAMEATRLSIGSTADTEAQRRMHDNAFGSLLNQLGRACRGLPERSAAVAPAPAAS